MNDSAFYTAAYTALKREVDRLEAFTGALDKDPAAKKAHIADYKCAKYRYATVSEVHSMLLNCYRLKNKLYSSHYLLLPVEEQLLTRADYVAIYDNAPDAEKPDVGLYYGMLAFTDFLIADTTAKRPLADDWERIELSHRLDGYAFGKMCLENAWRAREEAGA